MTAGLSGTSEQPGPTDAPTQDDEFAPGSDEGTAVAVAYCHSSRVSHSWHRSMMQLVGYDKSVGANLLRRLPFAVSCSGPGSLVEGRNLAVKHFLDESDEDYLLFVDTDMGFTPDAVETLVFAADPVTRPVVGGLCFALKHTGPDGKGGFNVTPLPTLFQWGETPEQGHGFVSRFKYPENTLTQVAGTGAAFLLVHRSVYERLRKEQGDTWFNEVQYLDGTKISEDLSFCYRVGQLDVPVYVHTGVSVTHHKELWLSDKDYRQPEREPRQRWQEAKSETGPKLES